MPAPRQKTETLKKHLTNEEKETRLKQEEILGELPKDKIRPPTWLSKRGKKIFKEIVTELDPIKILANLDVHNLAVLSDTFDKFVEATIALNTSPLTVLETNKNGSTREVPSPYIRIQTRYSDLIKKHAVEFGLTPASRQRLIEINTELKSEDEEEFEDKFGDI